MATGYIPWARERTEDMVEERPERSRRRRETVKLFRRAVAERKLVFRLVESVKQSKEKICEGVSVLAMMCIAKVTGRVVLPRVSSSYRQVQRRSVLSRVCCA